MWDPCKECVKITSNKILDIANMDKDDLYWAMNPSLPSPKQKCTQIDKESLNIQCQLLRWWLAKKESHKVGPQIVSIHWSHWESHYSICHVYLCSNGHFSDFGYFSIDRNSFPNQNGEKKLLNCFHCLAAQMEAFMMQLCKCLLDAMLEATVVYLASCHDD